MIRNLSQEPGRATAAIVSLLLVTVVYWPIHHNWSEESADDFPLSSYPMFTS